jgi:hypothetical protein|tara:strand:+ start:1027 stop:1365 length:339 start_codon:yes stop_codon:yes gene_type:complete
MDLRSYVRENQHIITFVHQATPGVIDKYVGTLDYATARFNTILLKLSDDPLRADIHRHEIDYCFQAIQTFYEDTKRYLMWPYVLKPIMAIKLHWTGKIGIPKIKRLLQKIDN